MGRKVERNILKKGDVAYFSSRQFFPKSIRNDIAKLYSFVHVVSGYAASTPPGIEPFKYIVRRWQAIKKTKDFGHFKPLDKSIAERVLGNLCYLIHKYEFDVSWVDNFLKSVAMDMRSKSYATIHDTVDYLHGAAEVLALMVARIMKLPNASMHFAKMQGRAFEFVHFLRDLDSNSKLGRNYFPTSEIKKFGLDKLDETNALKHPDKFEKFMRFQIKRYRLWQEDANRGLQFVPRRMRVALRAAIDVYAWKVKKIEKDPYIVFEKKIRVRRHRVLRSAVRRFVRP